MVIFLWAFFFTFFNKMLMVVIPGGRGHGRGWSGYPAGFQMGVHLIRFRRLELTLGGQNLGGQQRLLKKMQV